MTSNKREKVCGDIIWMAKVAEMIIGKLFLGSHVIYLAIFLREPTAEIHYEFREYIFIQCVCELPKAFVPKI